MEQIMNYVKPELVVVAIALYFVGIGLKNTEKVAEVYSSNTRCCWNYYLRYLRGSNLRP